MDGSFARNAERLVSHASREYDRSLNRYWDLFERYGNQYDGAVDAASDFGDYGTEEAEADSSGHHEVSDGDFGGGSEPNAAAEGLDEDLGVWSDWTADQVVDLLLGRGSPGSTPPTRNEPENPEADL